MSFRLWKGHGHPSLWNVEWNREGEPCEFVKGVAEQGDIATAGLHTLAKCIDDLKQDVDGIHKETDWATHMGERFNLAVADIDKMKEDISLIKFALTTHIGAHKKV